MIKILQPCFIRMFVCGEWHDVDAKPGQEFDETDPDIDIDDLIELEDYELIEPLYV